MKAAIAILLLVSVVLARAHWVSCRKVDNRDARIAQLAADKASLTAELTLTQEACDRQTVKARHLLGQAKGYRDEVLKLSARNADLRDQLDIATGAVREPSLVEEITAFLGTQPTTDGEDPR